MSTINTNENPSPGDGKEILRILQLDWTESLEENQKLLHDNYFLPAEEGSGEHFLSNYKEFLITRNGCFEPEANNVNKCIENLKIGDFRLTVDTSKMREVIRNFSDNKVLATKICFGYDKPIQEGGRMQLTVSGTFWAEVKDLNDKTDIVDRIFVKDGIVPRFRNFDEEIGDTTFSNFHNNLTNEIFRGNVIENSEKGAIFGYVMSTKTLLSMLEKEDQFGACQSITFDFGMSLFRIGQEGTGKLLMVKIFSSDRPSPVYWLRDTSAVPHGDLTCPPREPCK